MEIIKNLVQTLIIIVILAVFLDMLLPTGQMKPYVKMVMGLLVIIAVLQAISGILQQDWLQEVPRVKAQAGGPGPPLEEIVTAGKQLQLENQNKALEKYRQGISAQVLSLAKLSPGAKVVDADVKISDESEKEGYGRITHITLTVDTSAGQAENPGETGDPIQPVQINVGESGSSLENSQQGDIPPELIVEIKKVKEYIAGFYNLSPDHVSINYINP